jgi:hypothetical protein
MTSREPPYRPPPGELVLFCGAWVDAGKPVDFLFRSEPAPGHDVLAKIHALNTWRRATLARFTDMTLPHGIDSARANTFLATFGLTWPELNALAFRSDPPRRVSVERRCLVIYLPATLTF